MSERAPGRRTFGPVVLAGVAGTGLTALAADHAWVRPNHVAMESLALIVQRPDKSPLALALSLVTLAAWGVLLVTRGRVRRALAVLAALAALGTLATVVLAWWQLTGDFRDDLSHVGVADARFTHTAWWWTALIASVIAAVAAALAVRLVPGWPEMGSRYDAPVASAPPTTGPDADSLELWRALDDGQDPTADDAGRVS